MRELRGKRRVLILVENLPVPFDRRVWMEANALKGAGHTVTVICPTGKGFVEHRERINGIEILRYDLPPEVSSRTGYVREYAVSLWSQLRLALGLYRRDGFDIVHICNPPDLMFLVAGVFKLFCGVRVIFDHHDLAPELYEAKFGERGVFHTLLVLAERLTYLTADVSIATNESYKQIAITRGCFDPSNVFVVRSAPDLSVFRPVSATQEFRRGREFLVGYLGVMGEFDGVEYLLRAARDLVHVKGRRDIHFCLIGSGPSLASLKRVAAELNLGEYVEFTGRVSDTELIARICSCDVCVDPDPKNGLNDKSTMNKIMEYMALGRPIAQFDLKEGRFSAADAALYALPNDSSDLARAIEELLDDPVAREQMSAVGRKRMEELLEWRHQAPVLLEAYDAAACNQ